MVPFIPKNDNEANMTPTTYQETSSSDGSISNNYASKNSEYTNYRDSGDYVAVVNSGGVLGNKNNTASYHTTTGGKYVKNTTPIGSVKNDKYAGTKATFSGINVKGFTSKVDMTKMVEQVNSALNLPISETEYNAFKRTTEKYNRFKIPNPNLALQKGYPHIFFTRPECNILDANGKLSEGISGMEYFKYVAKSMPDIINELSSYGHSNDFMFSLSNGAASFSTSDEYINTDTYGRGYTGYKIAFGKNDIESKTANDFTVEFQDDRNMHIYKIIRAWVTYISGVFRGEIPVDSKYILNKILKYVSTAYYIVTAENNSDIIFWSKYYGVFPSTIPSNQYSWAAGNAITDTKLSIEFKYSFKEDYNPIAIGDFNRNARMTSPGTFLTNYDGKLGHSGTTWSSCPYIEAVKDGNSPFYYRLKFRE